MRGLFDLNHTVAVVTGAGQGNGLAISQGLRAAGAEVVGVDVQFSCEIAGTFQLLGDVTSRETLLRVIRKLDEYKYSHLVLVNNAGVTFPCDGSYPEELWRLTMEVNLTAPFLWINEFTAIFRTKRSGSIINITSLGAERAFPNNPAYVASKGGLKMLSKYYAKALGPYGVRVNNIGPGYIVTEMTRKSFANEITRTVRENHTFLGRWGQSTDLVGACVFLASNSSNYITGQDIYIDGGWTANGLVEQ